MASMTEIYLREMGAAWDELPGDEDEDFWCDCPEICEERGYCDCADYR